LKKQSQFAGDQNDVTLAIIMTYGDFGRWRWRKNKANSKPNNLPGSGRRKNKAKQSQFINVQCYAFCGLRQDEIKKMKKNYIFFLTICFNVL
jgi:hypothetical protein